MNSNEDHGGDTHLAEASAWLVRLQGPELAEADGLEFDAWLDAAAENRAAYDQVLATWHEFGGSALQVVRELDAAKRRHAKSLSRRWYVGIGGLAAAATVALVVLPEALMQPRVQTYATTKGEHRTVKLADGSTVDLNAQTRLSVTIGRHERRVVMAEGEAIFDVTKDPHRPFAIAASDRIVRVVGTQFDVRHRPDGLAVAVARGVVEVRPAREGSGRHTYVLHPGQRLDVSKAGEARLSAANTADTFSWRMGRLIYRDEPLSKVIADLNLQFADPIKIQDPELAKAHVSGVIILDNQAEVLRRLALMLPIKAVASDRGVLILPK